MQRIIAYALCLLVVALSGACSTPGGRIETVSEASQPLEPELEPASWQQKTDPVTLSMAATNVWLDTDGQFPLWAEDEVSRRITDLTGVKLNIIMGNEVSVGQGILNVILASNDFPDLLFVHQDKEVIQLSDRSYSQPLDELAAQYCPDFWDSLDPVSYTHLGNCVSP